MNTKICTKCKEECPATSEFFDEQRGGKYGLRGQCKSCVKIYNQANKEKISKQRKQYYQDNKEKILKTSKQYREANKDKIAERGKQYYKDNKETIAEYQKQHYQNNKEKITERNKQYYQKNRYLYRQKRAKRRAAEGNQTPDYTNLDLIKLIYENCPDGYQVDHMTPISKGGLHHESNLCYLPASINIAKGAKSIEEFGEDVFNQHVIYWQDEIANNYKLVG